MPIIDPPAHARLAMLRMFELVDKLHCLGEVSCYSTDHLHQVVLVEVGGDPECHVLVAFWVLAVRLED